MSCEPDLRRPTMNFEDLTPEQQEKAKACKTPEDILALAKEEGYELSEDELAGISGGWCPTHCNKDCSNDHCNVFFL